MTNAPTPLFRTERLRARRMRRADETALLHVHGDAQAMRWVGDGQPITPEGCARWVEVTERNNATRGYGMMAIELSSSGELIGFCGLVHPGGQREVELEYAYRREHWGRGYASEVARGMLRYGAATFGMTHVIATIAPDNLASVRVVLKAGMRLERERRNEDGSLTAVYEWRLAEPGPD